MGEGLHREGTQDLDRKLLAEEARTRVRTAEGSEEDSHTAEDSLEEGMETRDGLVGVLAAEVALEAPGARNSISKYQHCLAGSLTL